jgi:kinesin family member 17
LLVDEIIPDQAKIADLGLKGKALKPVHLKIKDDPVNGIGVKDLTIVPVTTEQHIFQLINKGILNRKVGETAMNAESSRSHSIFTIYFESTEVVADFQRCKSSKLNLIDLAGSERQDKTHAKGERLNEANKINQSLSALGNVIERLTVAGGKHVPYRNSKLTLLLRDSLGGNTKTLMIANIAPSDYNLEETLSTLRYASRAKKIKNKPIVNEDPKDALLREYEKEIARLKLVIE